jgi:AbrB family looped-hinge helix DNA binding protein
MAIRNSAAGAISRIGQRRQVVIPKTVFDALHLREGDFLEMTVERGRLAIQPKRLVDVSVVLSKSEAAKVRRGEAQLKARRSKPWQTDDLQGAQPGHIVPNLLIHRARSES